MPKPIKHREFVRRLRALGWEGPEQKGAHPFMVKDQMRLTIPNPHRGDLDWSLVKRIIAQAGILPSEWEKLGRH
jgi:predicted RNA binding protein YcfA (HicA-like mRNA interferase family)